LQMSSGVHDDLNELSTEERNPVSANIDCLSPLEIVRIINSEDARVATAVEAELPQIAAAIEQITERLGTRGGRLIYLGAGTSGRLGVLDASECPPTFSTPPGLVVGRIAGGPQALTDAVEELEDSAEAGRADVERLGISAADAVVGITASGRTPYVLGAIEAANELGAFTIGLACNANSELARLVQIMIAPLVGPEVVAGSTRLKAGTAQKMVLNMLSTGTMIRLGKTFGNLMVDVAAANDKLRERVRTIVHTATGADPARADAALEAAGGSAKVAIVSLLAGVDADVARERLASSDDNVRVALEST
jgi:N-acetylmuramic acid 6-phosphate etherase